MALENQKQQSQGYSEPDYAVRCKKCSIGIDNLGRTIGAVVSSYHISCQMDNGSVHVATIGRCTKKDDEFRPDGSKVPNCQEIYSFKMEQAGIDMELMASNVLNCCKHSKGNHFTYKELKQGYIDFAAHPSNPQEVIKVISKSNLPYKDEGDMF